MERKNLILPKNGVVLDPREGERVYFLAGPIRGANDWQAEAIKLLNQLDPNCYIVCPCRYDDKHELFKFSLPPTFHELVGKDEREIPTRALTFERQTLWERHYLERASFFGSIIFWLPCEDKNNPRKKEDGPYARDTYGEIGRWSMKSALPNFYSYSTHWRYGKRVNVVMGAEKEFNGLSVIQANLDEDHGKPFQIYNSLFDTISAAVKLAKKYNPSPFKIND